MTARRSGLLRPEGHGHAPVTNVELFFDLVFVFAVTQLSHTLLGHLTLAGAGQVLLLFVAMWWAWMYTSWVTNWLDPDRLPVRGMLFALMLAGLVMSMAIPEAFGPRALAFALAYAAMQVGRSLFMLWALRHGPVAQFANFRRILVWHLVVAGFWIGGALAGGEAMVGLWLAGLALECAGPWLGFHVPGLGRSLTTDWNVNPGHLAERCSLFVIIALGESLLVTGATFAEQHWAGEHGIAPGAVAFLAAVLSSIAMWWIYFDTGIHRATAHFTATTDPGRMARLSYTYLHLPLIAGIVVSAVADELAIVHPLGHADGPAAAAILGGPALYLLGNLLFKRAFMAWFPLSHLVGLALLALLVPAAPFLTPLALACGTTLALVVTAGWESLSLRRKVHGAT